MSTLIEKLKELSDEYFDKYTHTKDRDDIVKSVTFDKCIDIVKQHSDWISVDERLPEDNQEVLAILELTGFYMLSFVSNGIWYNADDGEQIARHKDRQAVTHWMPTPQPPIEVQP